MLLYGLEPFDLANSDLRSLDFVVFMKLLKTTSMETVQLSQSYFRFEFM